MTANLRARRRRRTRRGTARQPATGRGSVIARRGAALALVGALPFAMGGSSCDPPPAPVMTETERVTLADGELRLDGRPWWPTGLNAYQLGTDWEVNVGCGAEVDPDAFFEGLPPRSLTRFNAFQNLAVNKHTGELDFTALDRVIAAAERHDQMVLPVLAGQDGACDDEVFKQRDWYVDGWTSAGSLPISHRDWVSTLVARWSGSSSIAAWEPVGEPEPSVCAGGDCSLEARTCPEDSQQVLRRWTDEVGQIIRDLDPGGLITAGVIGGDQCGIARDGYSLLAASPYVDVIQYHDYDEAGFLHSRLEEVEVPILVAELGIPAGSCLALDDRALQIGERLDLYRSAGAAGALLWAFVPDPRPSECTLDIGPADPVLAELASRLDPP